MLSRLSLLRLAALAAATVLAAGGVRPVAAAEPQPPRDLRDTGLYAEGAGFVPRPGLLSFTPQYPLWSDGASKRRWIALPPGRAIDAARPDAWQFPPGTRLWKEFAFGGRRIETRYIERRADGRWLFATYVWNAAGTQATLAPAEGIAALPREDAPDGRYDIPARDDCKACHESAAVPVLGFSALQLSPERDPNAVQGTAPAASDVDLPRLVQQGRLRHLPPALMRTPPRIAAASADERAALGYLHANCGHCHNADGAPAPVALRLAQTVAAPEAATQQVLRSLTLTPARWRPAGAPADVPPVLPGRPEASALLQRMHSRQPQAQMPPLGTRVPDAEGLALLTRWIQHDLVTPKETTP
ncbi:hypothetical protein [Aquabacterium sp.]|uniref:hypothetical protein n=1 Tax=Aquabacterium sp. TaxID=1872578 RepID=UPI003783BE21